MHTLSQKTWSDTQHEKLLSSCGEKGENKSKASQHNKEKGQAFEILRFHWRVFERGQRNLVGKKLIQGVFFNWPPLKMPRLAPP